MGSISIDYYTHAAGAILPMTRLSRLVIPRSSSSSASVICKSVKRKDAIYALHSTSILAPIELNRIISLLRNIL